MTVVAILLVLLVTVAPLGVAVYRSRAGIRHSALPPEERIRIGEQPTPDILISRSSERAERQLSADGDRLAQVRRLIERYPERGAEVIRSWMWAR